MCKEDVWKRCCNLSLHRLHFWWAMPQPARKLIPQSERTLFKLTGITAVLGAQFGILVAVGDELASFSAKVDSVVGIHVWTFRVSKICFSIFISNTTREPIRRLEQRTFGAIRNEGTAHICHGQRYLRLRAANITYPFERSTKTQLEAHRH